MNLANCLQVCLDKRAKKSFFRLLGGADPFNSSAELIGCFNLIFYFKSEDAVYKAFGRENFGVSCQTWRRKGRKKIQSALNRLIPLIDLACCCNSDYVAYKRRQKRDAANQDRPLCGREGAAYGMGLIDDTEDLIKTWWCVRCYGCFDDDNGSYTPAPNK